jgi:O-antigen/teichoic acid export membrane protein
MTLKNKLLSKFNMGSVSKNVSWILIQNVFSMICGVFVTAIVARHYGATGYGYINFAQSFVALFSFIAIMGTNHIIMKDLSEDKIDDGIILGSNLFIRIILAIISLFICQGISVLVYDKNINILILLFNLNTILCSFDVFSYYAQSKMQNKYISISKIISISVFSILKLLVVFLKLNISFFVLTYLIETIIYSILLYISYKKINFNKDIKWKINCLYIKELLKKGKYYALSSLMVTIYLRIDQVMLGTMISDKSQVGIYSAAVRISEIWTFVPISIITSYKPIIINEKIINKKKYDNELSKLYNIVSFVCVLFVFMICIFGKLGIHILYGNEYKSAYIPLILLTIGIWFGVLGNIHYVWMICENKEKYSIFYSFVGCLINIIFNFLLIPNYGMIGAAFATLISQIASNIISFCFIKDARILVKKILISLNPINGFKEIINKVR